AVLALDRQTVRSIGVGLAGLVADQAADGRTVRTLGVRTRTAQAAGSVGAGDDVAGGGVGGVVDRVGVVARGRHVIDDLDHQVVGGVVAVLVGDRELEGVGGVVAAGVAGQRVGVADVAAANRVDVQRAVGADDVRTGHDGDGLAVLVGDGDDRRGVALVVLDGAVDDFRLIALVVRIAVGALARTQRQALLVDRGLVGGTRSMDLRDLVVDADGQGRGRSVAVAVLQGVGEAFARVARRGRVAGVGIGAVGLHGERAVLALNRQTVRSIGVGLAGLVADQAADGRTVRTLSVRTRTAQATGSVGAGDDVAGGGVGGVVDRVGVVARGRHVIDDVDHQVVGGLVAVLVGDIELEGVGGVVAAGVGGQRVGVADVAAANRVDVQRAILADDVHASRDGDGLAVLVGDGDDRRGVA